MRDGRLVARAKLILRKGLVKSKFLAEFYLQKTYYNYYVAQASFNEFQIHGFWFQNEQYFEPRVMDIEELK